ncbi:MAG: thioredoxin fold domain-containing protein [Bacteroidia bacterium]
MRVWLWSACLWAQGTQGIAFFKSNWQEVLQKAQKEKKLVLVDFYTSWCGWCKVLDQKTFSDTAVGAFANQHFVSFKANAEVGETAQLARQSGVRAYPTIIIFSAQGEILHRIEGYLGPVPFLNTLKTIVSRHKKIDPDQPSWENFQDAYKAYAAQIEKSAWEPFGDGQGVLLQLYNALQNQDEATAQLVLNKYATAPFGPFLQAAYYARRHEPQLFYDHVQNALGLRNLSPAQALWLSSLAIYMKEFPAGVMTWIRHALQKDPSGLGFLTQAALYYRLGQVAEAQQAIKKASMDLSSEDYALQNLRKLLEKKGPR